MDKDFFFTSGIPSPIPTWKSLSPDLNCSSDQSMDCFFNPYIGGGSQSTNTSCYAYTTPVNYPPKLAIPIMDQFFRENLPNLGNSIPLSPGFSGVAVDPGFSERAARFSCFGRRSFNCRTSQLGLQNIELQYGTSTPLFDGGKLERVLSSPSLNEAGSPKENKNSAQTHVEMRFENGFNSVSNKNLSKLYRSAENSIEESSVSEQITSREFELRTPNELNPRKRKVVSREKSKENVVIQSKGEETADTNAKRPKPTEGGSVNGNGGVKTEEETMGNSANESGNESQKEANGNSKPHEPPKDYIHVRARRGQATDSHSLAERVRREKISERMKLLQGLVPGCNKVTGKALMLDEIINYVQSLQRQVEFLSMKLSSVNPSLDFNMDSLLSKDKFQPQGSLPNPEFPLDTLAPAFFGHQPQQKPLPPKISTQLDARLYHNVSMQLPLSEKFGEGLPQLQFPAFGEDDLQSIVQMGFGQNPDWDTAFHSQSFPVQNQTSLKQIKL